MNADLIRLFLRPILIGAGTLIVALLATFLWILHIQSRISTLGTVHSALQSEQKELQAKIDALKSEKTHVLQNCPQLTQEATEIPDLPSASSFDTEVYFLGSAAKVTFSTLGVSSPAASSAGSSSAGSSASAAGGLTTLSVTMSLSGTFGNLSTFLSELDTPSARILQVSAVSITPTGSVPVFSAAGTAGNPVTPGPGIMNMRVSGDIFYGGGIDPSICAGVSR